MKALVETLTAAAAAKKSALCLSRCMQTRAVAGAGFRRSGACDPGTAEPAQPSGRPWWPFWRGNRDGVCARACSVDTSVSRIPLRCRGMLPMMDSHGARLHGPERQLAGLIRDADRLRQCDEDRKRAVRRPWKEKFGTRLIRPLYIASMSSSD